MRIQDYWTLTGEARKRAKEVWEAHFSEPTGKPFVDHERKQVIAVDGRIHPFSGSRTFHAAYQFANANLPPIDWKKVHITRQTTYVSLVHVGRTPLGTILKGGTPIEELRRIARRINDLSNQQRETVLREDCEEATSIPDETGSGEAPSNGTCETGEDCGPPTDGQ